MTASSTNWNNFYNTPSTRITAGTALAWDTNTLNHSTANGYIHIPSSGSSAQMLQYQGTAGTAKWITLSGDATIADGGAVAVADDSHNHTGTTISGSLTLTGVSSTYATATNARITNASTTNLSVSGNSYLGTILQGTWNGSVIGTGYLGTGTANAGSYLAGDGTWKATSTLNIFSSPLTTKGDILVYSTTNTRLPVGGNTQYLIASSSATTGLEWSSSTVRYCRSPSGIYNNDTSRLANVDYAYTFSRVTCIIDGATTSTLPAITLTFKTLSGTTIGTLNCNTSTALVATTTFASPAIPADDFPYITYSNSSGTFSGVTYCIKGYR